MTQRLLANVLAIIPSARLPDRIGRKPVIYASCAIGFVGVALAALAPAIPFAIVGGALFGASAGTFLAVDWAGSIRPVPGSQPRFL